MMMDGTRRDALLDASSRAAGAQMVVLIAIFIALPTLFYAVVQAATAQRRIVMAEAARTQGALVVRGLMPVLEGATPADAEQLGRDLSRFQSPNVLLSLYFRPVGDAASSGVFFIASGTSLNAEQLSAENARLQAAGIFRRIIERCAGAGTAEPITIGADTALTTVAHVLRPDGCWGIVTVLALPAAQPFRSNPALPAIALAYAGIVLLALASAGRVLVSLRRAQAFIEGSPSPADQMLLDVPQPVTALPSPIDATRGERPASSPHPFEMEDADDLLNTARNTINLSQMVRDYVAAETRKWEDGAERLQSEIEDDIVLSGRSDFITTILTELVSGALRDGGSVRVTLASTRDDSRRKALLAVTQRGGVFTELGRLPLVKQFVSALHGVGSESQDESGTTVRIAFPA